MSQTFTYNLDDNGVTSEIVVTTTEETSNSTGSGQSYAVTAISGNFEGTAITGEGGTGGTEQVIGDSTFDNAIFINPADGSNDLGSLYGIDNDGLEFNAGGQGYNIYLNGSTFEVDTSAAGVEVSTPTVTSTNAPCYCSGTLILTDRGELPVSALAVGDTVITASGQHRPIKWIGRRSYAGRFLTANPNVRPIRFRAGSLGDRLPRRDLLVSPEHALFLNGVLIPAKALVNESTITQERGLNRVDYFHIELESHDVLLAEGAPSESFLEDANRGQFHNAAEHGTLSPDALAAGGRCAPWVDSGVELEAIRARLAEMAGEFAQAA